MAGDDGEMDSRGSAEEPFFSVVVPVYNTRQYLTCCIDSIVQQTFVNWEALLIDDGSTDGCGALLDSRSEADSRLRVVHQQNQGLSVARNRGIEMARGQYVVLLDSDDWIEPTMLQQLHSLCDGADMVAFGGWGKKNLYRPSPAVYATGWQYYNAEALQKHTFNFVCTVLRTYRRAFWVDKGITFQPGLVHEDNLFTPLVCHAAERVVVADITAYHYRVQDSGTLHSASNLVLIDIANQLFAHFEQHGEKQTAVIYRYIVHLYQMGFLASTAQTDHTLLRQANHRAWSIAAQHKLRHRINHLVIRTCPPLYRLMHRIGL
ncbi:MAG: glycosyltransferase [Bacteroidales bacterium]|nr:glycosyltransferase [Bacteroidales bacterium]MBR1799444.1 glycosyltransferase [Bacteroidales bacterium]